MTNEFKTTLHVKPIHSRCTTPWDSHGSIASKRSTLIGETNGEPSLDQRIHYQEISHYVK